MPSRLPPYSGAPYIPSQQCPYKEVAESFVGPQPSLLLRSVDRGEVVAEGGQPLPVLSPAAR